MRVLGKGVLKPKHLHKFKGLTFTLLCFLTRPHFSSVTKITTYLGQAIHPPPLFCGRSLFCPSSVPTPHYTIYWWTSHNNIKYLVPSRCAKYFTYILSGDTITLQNRFHWYSPSNRGQLRLVKGKPVTYPTCMRSPTHSFIHVYLACRQALSTVPSTCWWIK